MSIRPRLLLILAIGIVPLAGLSLINYLLAVRSVEGQLRDDVQRDANSVARIVETRLREREDALRSLARSGPVRAFVQNGKPSPSEGPSEDPSAADVQSQVREFLQSNEKYFVGVACLNSAREPLFYAALGGNKDDLTVRFKRQDFLPDEVQPDERVWEPSADTLPLRSSVRLESYGPALRYTIPVSIESSPARGALIVDLRLDALLDEAASVSDSSSVSAPSSPPSQRLVVMVDGKGNIVYHSNDALNYRPVKEAMPPAFGAVSDAMKAGQAGSAVYDSIEGDRWLAVYQPLQALNLSVAVAGNRTAAVRSLGWLGWLSIGLTVIIGLIVAGVLLLALNRTTRSIQRVTEGAVAIAGGKLDEHIEVRSSDETRLLAETFNAMTDRLREQIAREAESRQFASFMRLSAILTHDLKNSILALSLLVSNMEQQFDDAEFRVDAMRSLTEATDKLRALVAKLSEPVRSLSGEFKRPGPVDLVPVIKRVMARLADPASLTHEVQVHLPQTLVAVADDERIEKVVENLVLNAIEAMDAKEGKLTISGGAADDGFVFFSVADTGPGMTEAFQRSSLFRPFATTKTRGVGLGLYTCRELIRALGGRMEVESERGSGTCLRVVLPSPRITKSV